MSRPIFKFAVALFVLVAAILLWCNWAEVVDWICEVLHIYELIDWFSGPGCFGKLPSLK